MKISELICYCLKDNGVKRIYGLIGTSIVDFVDSIRESGIRYISTRHEYGAIAMADGESRVTGKLGVAAVHAGPGFLNSLTGIANSYKDSSSLLIVSGSVKRRLQGTNSWLEVDQLSVVRHITKGCFLIDSALKAADIINNAISQAISLPHGPVFIEVPEDFWRFEVAKRQEKVTNDFSTGLEIGSIEKVTEMLKQSKRPLVLAGGGINSEEGSRILKAFLEKTSVPVVTTGNGRGAISEDEGLCLGRVGFGGGNVVADYAFIESDFVLALGCGLSDLTTYGYNFIPKGKIVSVELNKEWEKKPVNYALHIEGDAANFLVHLTEQLGDYRAEKDWLSKIEEQRTRLRSQLSNYLSREKEGYVNPGLFLSKVDFEFVDYVLSVGQGFHTLYPYIFMKVRRPRSFLASTNMGSMGFALPASIGANIAIPERNVFCIIGDGEFLMSFQELETVVREKVPVKIIVLNDNSYRVLYMRQKIQKMGRVFGTLHTNPDFIKLADSFGIEAFRVDTNSKIEKAIDFLKDSTSPKIVELVIDRDDFPPINVQGSLAF